MIKPDKAAPDNAVPKKNASTPKAPSIERQLRFKLLLALLAVLLISLMLINTLSSELTRNYVLSRLEHDAQSLIAALEADSTGQLQLEEQRIPDLYRRTFSGHYYRIELPDRLLRSRSLWDIELPDALLKQQLLTPDEHRIEQQLLLTYHTEVSIQQQKVSVWLAEDIHPLANETRRFNLSVIGFLMVAFAALWWLQGRTLRHSFRFFEQLRQRVQSLHQGSGQKTGFQPPLEIRPLSDEINRLVDQLGQRTERSRSALGNFAHELKRPLQQLRLQQLRVQQASLEQTSLPEQEQQMMADSLNQIQYLLDRELKRARIAGRCLPGQAFHPDDDIAPLLQVMERIYPAITFSQQLNRPASQTKAALSIDRDDTLELLGNLLDNAAKYARSQVLFTLSVPSSNGQEQAVLFCIEDDGEGVDEALLEQLTLRGTKLDEAVTGHGLGLSICKSICDSYQAELTFARSALGGLKVSARFVL